MEKEKSNLIRRIGMGLLGLELIFAPVISTSCSKEEDKRELIYFKVSSKEKTSEEKTPEENKMIPNYVRIVDPATGEDVRVGCSGKYYFRYTEFGKRDNPNKLLDNPNKLFIESEDGQGIGFFDYDFDGNFDEIYLFNLKVKKGDVKITRGDFIDRYGNSEAGKNIVKEIKDAQEKGFK